jgi:hypothetical protein
MRTTERQLLDGVCESIARTTPNFRPPSRATRTMRVVIAWAVAIVAFLFLAALLRAQGG